MKIQKKELAQKLNKIKGVVPKRNAMPALQGILVKDGYFIASNTEITIKEKVDGIEGECFIIPERAFDLINNLPDSEVDISIITGNAIEIKVDGIKNTYQTLAPEQFPMDSVQETENLLTIKAKTLLKSMGRVSYAIPIQGGNAIMSSMCLRASGGQLDFVGLDGHMLAWDKVEHEGDFELLVPKDTVDKLLSLGLSGEVLITHNRTGAVFITEEFEIYTRLIEGKYFNYQAMFSEPPFHTIVSRTSFLNAMTRAKMCADERHPAKFELQGKQLKLSIKDSLTDYQETVELQECIEKPLVIGFNAKLVLKTLNAFDCDNVSVSFDSPRMPMIIEEDNGNFKAIVLPVKIA